METRSVNKECEVKLILLQCANNLQNTLYNDVFNELRRTKHPVHYLGNVLPIYFL